MKFKSLRGMDDLFYTDLAKWQTLETEFKSVFLIDFISMQISEIVRVIFLSLHLLSVCFLLKRMFSQEAFFLLPLYL